MNKWRIAPILIILALTISGCDVNKASIVTIHQEEMGQDWPLTIEKGYLACHCVERNFWFWCSNGAVTIHDPNRNVTYSVNDVHLPTHVKANDIEPIRLFDSREADLGPLIKRGLALC